MKKNTVLVVIENGMVQDVYASNEEIGIVVFDRDAEENGDNCWDAYDSGCPLKKAAVDYELPEDLREFLED